MKTFLLFWTYSANYANHPTRIESKNFLSAIQCHPYSATKGVRFLVFEEGGGFVWNGTTPSLGHEVGNVQPFCHITLGQGRFYNNQEQDAIGSLFDLHLKNRCLPLVQEDESKTGGMYKGFRKMIKSAFVVGPTSAPEQIWLTTSDYDPSIESDLFYRAL